MKTTNKNYQLRKFLIAKSGIIIGSNKFGQIWVEFRLNNVKKAMIFLKNPDKINQSINTTKPVTSLHRTFPPLVK